MLIAGIALGLVLGLLLGGRLERLADIRLRFLPLLFLAVILRFATEAMLGFGVEIVGHPAHAAAGNRVRAAAVHALEQPLVPGPGAGVHRDRVQRAGDPCERRAHAGVGARAGGLGAAARIDLDAAHPGPGDGRGVPGPAGPARGHHPDPDPTVPERRLHRRPVPDRRPRVLPVRHADADAGRDAGGDRRGEDRPLPGPLGNGPPATAPRSRGGRAGRRGPGRSRGHRPHAGPGWSRRPRATADDGRRQHGHVRRRPRPRSRLEGGGAAVARPRRGRHPPCAASPPPAPAAGPPPPVRPPGAQRLVLGALGRPGHQPVRRPGEPDRAGSIRLRDHETHRSRLR